MITALSSITLRILVFGPSPSGGHSPGFTADLAKKRAEIRDALVADGHQAVFPEDIMSASIDPALDNIYLWELVLVREYDMIVNLVGTPGAVSELSLCMRDTLALKTALFFNYDHVGGLAYQQAKVMELIGATLSTYTYPADLISCNLMKEVRNKVHAVRVGKFLSP